MVDRRAPLVFNPKKRASAASNPPTSAPNRGQTESPTRTVRQSAPSQSMQQTAARAGPEIRPRTAQPYGRVAAAIGPETTPRTDVPRPFVASRPAADLPPGPRLPHPHSVMSPRAASTPRRTGPAVAASAAASAARDDARNPALPALPSDYSVKRYAPKPSGPSPTRRTTNPVRSPARSSRSPARSPARFPARSPPKLAKPPPEPRREPLPEPELPELPVPPAISSSPPELPDWEEDDDEPLPPTEPPAKRARHSPKPQGPEGTTVADGSPRNRSVPAPSAPLDALKPPLKAPPPLNAPLKAPPPLNAPLEAPRPPPLNAPLEAPPLEPLMDEPPLAPRPEDEISVHYSVQEIVDQTLPLSGDSIDGLRPDELAQLEPTPDQYTLEPVVSVDPTNYIAAAAQWMSTPERQLTQVVIWSLGQSIRSLQSKTTSRHATAAGDYALLALNQLVDSLVSGAVSLDWRGHHPPPASPGPNRLNYANRVRLNRLSESLSALAAESSKWTHVLYDSEQLKDKHVGGPKELREPAAAELQRCAANENDLVELANEAAEAMTASTQVFGECELAADQGELAVLRRKEKSRSTANVSAILKALCGL